MTKSFFKYALALTVLLLFGGISMHCQTASSDWIVEAEDTSTTVTWKEGMAEIRSPKGMTLWYKKKLKGKVVIEYDAMVVVQDSTDRLSDLNCFWMASDPKAHKGSIWQNMQERQGIFKRCYAMQLYYFGFGGNYNKTSRFRRYDGQTEKPAILKEYTDALHLLKPNHWYHIRLESIKGRVRYTIDGETLVDYQDPTPLRSGWFGFRTTWSHILLRPHSIHGQ